MDEKDFLLEDKIDEIKSKFKIKCGWLKIYENDNLDTFDDSSALYCCLISNTKLDKYSKDETWPLFMGREGKPTVYSDNSYRTYDEEGLEPFIFYKSFSFQNTTETYIDIAEEFVLYFKLYEKVTNKQNRVFYYVTDYGDLEDVIIIEPNLIKIKIKYLKEYITMRDMTFVLCYEYIKMVNNIPSEWEIEFKDELIIENGYIYSHLIRFVSCKIQNWITGKAFIRPNEDKKSHFNNEQSNNQSFIVGIDDDGEHVYEDCVKINNNTLKITYFKKGVLEKYYNEPNVYQVDGFHLKSKFFSLKIDNNVDDYVPVFLKELRTLPENEQIHWKQYNIPPEEGMNISRTYYRTMIEGNWNEEAETVDLIFKSKYKSFNKKWENKFGWSLYKPLSKVDEHLFISLHKITTDNVKTFCEQTLTIVKLIIDRLNETQLAKGLVLDENLKGIGKFEKFLESKGLINPDMFEFLRNLQSLRSGLIAHSFSDSNKGCKNAINFFGIGNETYIKIMENIFQKSIFTLNTLEKHFNLDE